MKNTNTTAQNTNESIINNGTTLPDAKELEILQGAQHAVNEAKKADDVVAEVVKAGKLKGLKANVKKRDWTSIIGTGVIGMSGAAADMIVTNKLVRHLHGEDARQYSVKEIIGVTVATGLVASTVRAGLDFVPQVHNNDVIGITTSSVVGNGSFVVAAMVRNSVLDLIKNKFSVSVEELAEEA